MSPEIVEIFLLIITLFAPLCPIFVFIVEIISRLVSCLDTLSSSFLSIASSIILVIALIKLYRKYRGKSKAVYDAKHLADELRSKSSRAPAVDLDDLVQKITGFDTKKTKKEELQVQIDVRKNIEDKIEEIKADLISDSGDNTLIIEGKWGSGKTTNILIAISELKAKGDYRYIYESAFKYTKGLNEYLTDLITALFDVMDELGIAEKKFANDLIKNLHSDAKESLISTLYASAGEPLTSDIILKINSDYREKFKTKKPRIVIIMDDVDRLQGEDVLKCLSVLSVIRRLEFVKIILPIDREAVVAALASAKIHGPEIFIRKYLPEQQTVYIESAYEIIKTIIIGKFGHSKTGSNVSYDGLWEAILFFMWSIKMEELLTEIEKGGQSTVCAWPGISLNNFRNIAWTKGQIYNYLRAPIAFRAYNEKKMKDRFGNSATWKYLWETSLRHPKFEDILLRLETHTNRGVRNFIKDDLTDECYQDLIHPWIQEYASRHWQDLDINLRDIIDHITAQRIDGLDWPEAQSEQFRVAFNALFRGELLKVVSKDKEKK